MRESLYLENYISIYTADLKTGDEIHICDTDNNDFVFIVGCNVNRPNVRSVVYCGDRINSIFYFGDQIINIGGKFRYFDARDSFQVSNISRISVWHYRISIHNELIASSDAIWLDQINAYEKYLSQGLGDKLYIHYFSREKVFEQRKFDYNVYLLEILDFSTSQKYIKIQSSYYLDSFSYIRTDEGYLDCRDVLKIGKPIKIRNRFSSDEVCLNHVCGLQLLNNKK